MTPIHRATHDPRLDARVFGRAPLRYAAGADAGEDRPGHVRAGSALARVGGRLAVVQDDAGFVALVDPATARVAAVPLPAGPGGRRQFDERGGNKALKLDLEACIAVPSPAGDRLIAFGSGSTRRRERVVSVRWDGAGPPRVDVQDLPAWYGALRTIADFAGSELNLEGATVVGGDTLRLFQRGNGAARGSLRPVDATADVALAEFLAHLDAPGRCPVPQIGAVTAYDLGAIGGVRLTFTDAAATEAGVYFLAVAEDSPDAVRDGPVRGCALGVIDPAGRARWTPLLDASGTPFAGKVEGLSPDPADPCRGFVVLDRDDPDAPCELAEYRLRGPWRE